MKNLRFALTVVLAFALVTVPLFAVSARAQDPQIQNQAGALMRGYRTGYSDGYQAGINDSTSRNAREFRTRVEYQRADRAYASAHGTLEDYRDGYQQGFEAGYNNGYDRRPFDSTIPADLKRRAKDDDSTVAYPTDANKPIGNASGPGATLMIARDTIMRVELLSSLATDASQSGDHFQVRVIEPKEFEGATIEGQVTRVQRPGRAKGTAELQLSFDEIRLSDGRVAKMSAQVIEVLQTGAGEGVGKVDREGGVKGESSTKGDIQKVGAATGIGAIIGAIAGGGVGAAVGATIGAGVGTAGVLRQRGKEIRLYQGQHLRLRTAADAAIQ